MGKAAKIIGGIALTVGGALITAFVPGGQAWGIAIMVQGAGIVYGALQGAGNLESGGNLTSRQGRVLTNRAGTRFGLPVVYGKTRVAPIVADIRVDTNSSKNRRLVMVCALAHGSEDGSGIEAVDEIYLGDQLAWTLAGGVQSPFDTALPVSDSIQSEHLAVNVHLGTDAQAVDADLNSMFPTEWPSTAAGKRIAYVVLLMWHNPDVYGAGIPNVNAVIRGQKLFDPRGSQPTVYSTNPALAIRDFLTSTTYGFGIPAAEIDDTSISDTADFSDELVTPFSGASQQKRFEVGGWAEPTASIRATLINLSTSCRSTIINVGGLWKLLIRRVQVETGLAITPDNTVEGSWRYVLPGSSRVPNSIIASYPDPDRDYQIDSVQWPEPGQTNPFIDDDSGYEHQTRVDLPFTDNRLRAQQLGMTVLRENRETIGILLTAKEEFLQAEVGDLLNVTQPSPGFVAKPFWVAATNYRPHESLVDLVLVEYEPSVYTFDEQFPQPTIPNTGLPDSFVTQPPTGLVLTAGDAESIVTADGIRIVRIKMAWTSADDPFLSYYEIEAKRTSETDFDSYGTALLSDVIFFVSPVTSESWDVRIRAVNLLGVHSTFLTGSITPSVSSSIISDESIEVANTTARYRLRETDQTLPLGLWGLTLDGDILRVQKNTAVAGDFSTFDEFITVSTAGLVTFLPNATEAIRMVEDGAFLSFWNTVESVRTGYIQMQAAGLSSITVEVQQPLYFRTDNQTRVVITAVGGEVLVGTTTAATGAPRLDVIGSSGHALTISDSTADATTKTAFVALRHYTNAEEPLAVVAGQATVSANRVLVGGGSSLRNAATAIEFYTAANNTTPTGTLRASIDSSGFAVFQNRIESVAGTVSEANDLQAVRITGGTSARLQIFPSASGEPWQIDNTSGRLRFFLPGVEHMSLLTTTLRPDTAGGLTLGTSPLPWGASFFNGDLTLGSLGVFDSGSTPILDDVLRFNGTEWIPARIQFRFTDGDVAAQAYADGTASAHVDDGRAIDDVPVPVAPSAAPVLRAGYKTIVVDMSAHTLPADKKYVIQWSTDSGTTWSNDGGDVDEIVTTGSIAIHTKLLIDGTTYRYRFRERGATDSSPSPETADLAPLSLPDISPSTIIVAAQISTVDLSAISANVGVLTAGLIRNVGDTHGILLSGAMSDPSPSGWNRFLNLVDETDNFIEHERFKVHHDGTVEISDGTNVLFSVNAAGTAAFWRDSASEKFKIDLTNRIITIVDEQASPRTRVKIGEISTGLADWGLQVFNDAGVLLFDAQAANLQIGDQTGTVGINVKGTLPGSWTTFIDFTAAGANSVFEHPKFELHADGTAIFKDQIDITNATISQTLQDFHILFRDPQVLHGMTSLVETDILGAIGFVDTLLGGLNILGFNENTTKAALLLQGISGAATGVAIRVEGWKKSGTTRTAMTGLDTLFDVLAGNSTIYFKVQPDKVSALTNLEVQGQLRVIQQAGASALDWDSSNSLTLTNTGARTITMTNALAGSLMVLRILRGASAAASWTWPSTVKWIGGTAPTLSTAANKADIITFYYDGTRFLGVFNIGFNV